MNGNAIKLFTTAKLSGVIFDHERRRKEYLQQEFKRATKAIIVLDGLKIY